MSFLRWGRDADGGDLADNGNGRNRSNSDSSRGSQDDIQPLSEDQKWARSMARMNLHIDPSSEEFRTQINSFRDQLNTPGKSPHDVFVDNFSKWEIEKFELGYVDKKTQKATYDMQKEDARLYRERMDKHPWNTVAREMRSSLEFKLTMMYYGFPVEPSRFTDLVSNVGDLDGLSFFSAFQDGDDDQYDDDLVFVPEELRPLRFLNYYERRGYGKDNTHMNPDKTYELFYGIPMLLPKDLVASELGLRGGGDDAEEVEDMVMEDALGDALGDEDSVMSPQSASGASHASRITDRLALRGGSGRADGGDEVFIWGLSGRTYFSYADPKSFFTAIDRVLGLRKRSDGDSSVGITISLLSHTKGQRSPCTLLASDQCYLGRSEKDELNFYKTWLETLEYFHDELDEDQTFDICVSQISQDFHFSEGQEDLSYRPDFAENHQLVTFSLADEPNGNLAYLHMPETADTKTPASHYQEWFRSIWRTVARPNAEQEETWPIGSSDVLSPQPCTISISLPADVARVSEEICFHSDAGPTPQVWEWFIDAHRIRGVRNFVIHAVPTAGLPEIGSKVKVSNTIILSVPKKEQNDGFYWGCHDGVDDVVVFMEQSTPSNAGRQGHLPAPRHFETRAERASRTTGWEEPNTDHDFPQQPFDFTSTGQKINGTRLDDFAKGKALREWSYSRPLSIHMDGQHPSIPINAPSLEQILKTPNAAGLPVDTVPVISSQIMTATEQRALQEAFFQMRTFALERAQPCPYDGCREYFEVDREGMQFFRQHLRTKHVGTNCPFCTDVLFVSASDRQRKAHFLEKHAEFFSKRGDVLRDNTVVIRNQGYTHRREEAWKFCARCGRNHTILINKADRAQHDNICYPGNPSKAQNDKFCIKCGIQQPHNCAVSDDPRVADQTVVFCTDCALPTHRFSKVYSEKHFFHCKGAGTNRAKWCPWCGIDVKLCSDRERYQHLDQCGLRPFAGEGPIDTLTGDLRESPNDTEAHRRQALFSLRGNDQVPVPSMCNICGDELQNFNSAGIFRHFRQKHHHETNGMKICPFCSLDFDARKWPNRAQKEAHLDDHLKQRVERIMTEHVIARHTDHSTQEVQVLLASRNSDEVDKLELIARLKAEKEQLLKYSEDVRQLLQSRNASGNSYVPIGQSSTPGTASPSTGWQTTTPATTAPGTPGATPKPAPASIPYTPLFEPIPKPSGTPGTTPQPAPPPIPFTPLYEAIPDLSVTRADPRTALLMPASQPPTVSAALPPRVFESYDPIDPNAGGAEGGSDSGTGSDPDESSEPESDSSNGQPEASFAAQATPGGSRRPGNGDPRDATFQPSRRPSDGDDGFREGEVADDYDLDPNGNGKRASTTASSGRPKRLRPAPDATRSSRASPAREAAVVSGGQARVSSPPQGSSASGSSAQSSSGVQTRSRAGQGRNR